MHIQSYMRSLSRRHELMNATIKGFFSHTLNSTHRLTNLLLKAALGSGQGKDLEGMEVEPQLLGPLEQVSANSVKALQVRFQQQLSSAAFIEQKGP